MESSGGPISKVGRNLGRLRHASASWGCVILILGIHALVSSAGGPDALSGWYESLGLSRDGILAGKIWQIGSYGWLHGAWWHAGLNAWFVLVIGSSIERILGSAAMVRAVLAGVLGGGMCHLLLGSGLLVGLSGGGVALLLLLATLSPQSRMLPLPVSGKSLGWGILLAAGIFTLMDPALGLPGCSAAGRMLAAHGMGEWFRMGHACHFGGGVAGWLYGRRLLRTPVTLAHLRRERARREVG